MATDVPFILAFADVGPGDLPRVGGKAANLGALTRAEVSVPPGFCITTRAFDQFIAALPDPERHFAALDVLDGTSVVAARAAAESMRSALDAIAMPEDAARAIVTAWRGLAASTRSRCARARRRRTCREPALPDSRTPI
jgi:pyruvate,water dikinase